MSAATRPKARGNRTERLNKEVPPLMGVSEVAELLGVTTSNLDRVAGLPPAARRINAGRIWRADLIREFVRQREKRSGT